MFTRETINGTHGRGIFSPRRILVAGILLIGFFAITGAFTDTTLSGLDATRFAVLEAVGEQQVFHIENTHFRTVDAVRRNGHVYSDKPLLLGWSMGLIHRGIRFLTNWDFAENYSFLIWFYNALTGFVFNALLFWWLLNMFRRIRIGKLPVKGLLAFGGIASTWLWSYQVLLNNHLPAALAVLGVYVMLEKFRRVPSPALACGIGIAAGSAAAFDIPLGLLCCAAACLAVWQMGRGKDILYSAAGATAVLAGCGLLNFAAYDTWIPLYLAGDTGTFQVRLHFSIGYWVEALFGWRGFFLYQPFLLLGLIPRKTESVPDRWMYFFALSVIVFYCIATNEFGAAYGFRYLIPLIPVLYYRAVQWLLMQKMQPVRKGALAGFLLLWGILTSAVGAYAPYCVVYEGPKTPEGHFTRTVRSTFGGNLLCASFEYAPDSWLTEKLIQHYGKAHAYRFLYESYFNIKRPDLIRRTLEHAGRTYEKR